MVLLEDLFSVLDQSVWISDDRISALASARSGGIEQIDYHGVQPVSRNAKLLQHPSGVLKFELEWRAKDRINRLALDWQNLTIHPFGIEQIHYLDGSAIRLFLTAKQNQLSVVCIIQPVLKKINTSTLMFKVLWNKNSQTLDVHGDRSWQEMDKPDSSSILLRATDQISLWPWLKKEGDYQGDFLIPEGWRRMIFKRDCISGMAGKEDIKEGYKRSRVKLYDTDTFVLIGNSGFTSKETRKSWRTFVANTGTSYMKSWVFPEFKIQFFTQKPNLLSPASPSRKKENIWKIQGKRYKELQSQVPRLDLPQFPAIESFFRLTPQIIESAKVKDYGMTRACPGTYYWIWSWDNVVTSQTMARFGDINSMKRMADFLRNHRDLNGAIPGRWTRHLEPMDSRGIGGLDFLFCELILRLYSETMDRSVLQTNYPALHHAFRQVSQKCNDRGFFPTPGMYPDLPVKMGRSGQDFVAIDSGMWYCFCRNLEKIAWILGDSATASMAVKQADLIRANFLDLFWEDERGFLCDSVRSKSAKKNPTFPIFSLLFLENPFGRALLSNRFVPCSEFIESHLMSDTGLRVTPIWDINHTSEPVMSAWYPHWDLPATTSLSLAWRTDSLAKWLKVVHECYTTLGYCPEFIALNVPPDVRYKHHGAAWNLNCAAGWYNSIIQNIAGIEFDLGGITMRPIGAVDKISIMNLWFRGTKWDFYFEGQGNFIERLTVDNRIISGTWKIPTHYYGSGNHMVQIQLGKAPPKSPILTELWGSEVTSVSKIRKGMEYKVHGFGQTDLVFVCRERPKLILDDHARRFRWDSKTFRGSCQLRLSGTHLLKITAS